MIRIILPLMALSLAACAPTPTEKNMPLNKNPAITVGMGWHSFSPEMVTIKQGQSVQWNNGTLISHTVTCDPTKAKNPQDVHLPDGADAFDSGPIGAGKYYQYTFITPGTYRYFCIPHELKGMVGQVIVQPAGTP